MTTDTTSTDTTTADTLEEVLSSRYSCRGFLPQTVDPTDLRRLFTMAQRTASWCNSQAWQVELLGGDAVSALSERLLAHVPVSAESPDIPGPERYEGVYQDRRRACGFELYNALDIAREDQTGRLMQMLENFRFFGAPHVAIVTSPKALSTYGVMDCGGYVATLLTAAESLGINAIAQAAIAMYADVVRSELGIPEDRSIVCAVSLGYADPDHAANTFRTARADVDMAVTGLP